MDSLTKLNLDNYKPLRDVVFENLRSAILEGKLKSGQRLMEVQLAEQLGVSRTPVREAIRKLELEGLVVMLPRKGAYVANISVKDLMDVLEIRASLEGLGASLAAERRNDEDIKNLEELEVEFEEAVRTQNIDMLLKKDIEFHECIFKAANNKKLEDKALMRIDLFDNMKIKEVFAMFKDFYSDFDEEKANHLLEDLKLDEKSRLKNLSKGNKEKVQLILVMSRKADLYVLDEPIGGVDPAARDYILKTIIQNRSENSSVLISTHLISDIEDILDDVIFIKDGEILLQEDANELRRKHDNTIDHIFRDQFRI